jgi:NAD(P)-dependent dehydrogenase (short-subunit alcohol dehydrogenase family)
VALDLDVTDKAALEFAVRRAHANFARLEVVVRHAGFGLFGTIEEVSAAQARAQTEHGCAKSRGARRAVQRVSTESESFISCKRVRQNQALPEALLWVQNAARQTSLVRVAGPGPVFAAGGTEGGSSCR